MKPKSLAVCRFRKLLVVDRQDGHRGQIPLAELCVARPCAECRGGHERMTSQRSLYMLAVPLPPGKSAEIERVEMVDNYVPQPAWSDGHTFGFYPWVFLRQLCPCDGHGYVERRR